jgi:hypothetical protein
MGRRSKATEARIEALLVALRAGNTRDAAAGHAGIVRTTLYRWLERDPALRTRVEKAEADAEVRFEAQVAQGAGEDWRAAAWWLEHRRPASYGRAQAAAATAAMTAAPTPGPNPLDDLTADEIRERARIWALDLAALPPSAASSPDLAQVVSAP